MLKIYKLIALVALVLVGCSSKKDIVVRYSNPKIEYWGRIDSTKAKGASLYWSGTSIKMNFEGESVEALLKDETGDNFYNIIVDNENPVIFKPDTIKKYYPIASNLTKGKHAIEIFKRTEWDRGKTDFYGFKINKNAKLLPKPVAKKRKIEFYGNSITCGYAVEDFSGNDSPAGTFTNHYLSYAAITARHYDAQYQCIGKSGIGITVSWFPLTMPEMYDRLIPTNPASKWDFSLYTPDLVVINLFQNDSWIVNLPQNEEFKRVFGTQKPTDDFIVNAYQKFVANIRNRYPEARIICALGSMDATQKDSKWIDYIKTAVANLKDKHIYTHFIPFKETPGHPTIKEQEQMANSLIAFIDKNIEW